MKTTFVITGPSGIGKTYLAARILKLYPDKFTVSQLHTTRQPRTSESGQADRIFITQAEFDAMQASGGFVVTASFSGNKYGYAQGALIAGNRHLLVNAWPALLPKIMIAPSIKIIALTASENDMNFLIKRMEARGDSQQVIQRRLELMRRDIRDTQRFEKTISNNGRIFVVRDDRTIPENVLPWLENIIKD